jgi:hypothetical protein
VVLRRAGLGKRSRLGLPEQPNRYERTRPGELVHIDVKKLARFHRPGHKLLGRGPGRYDERQVGYDYVHVCVDDYGRLAYAEVLPNERARPLSLSCAGHAAGLNDTASASEPS